MDNEEAAAAATAAAAESVLKPIQVIYCGKCGMPPEFCEYGPDFESHCDPWLKKNQPVLHAKLASLRTDKPKTTKTQAGEDGADADATPEVDAGPTAPWTTGERLTAFYQKYQPDKLSDVPSMLEKFDGREEKLFVALAKKYGPEPEDPYVSDYEDDDDDDDENDDGLEEGMENLAVGAGGGKKRRGVSAKKTKAVETRVVVQKIARKGRKVTTVVVGMDTVPGIKLKDVSKTFSKRFAGSSSVKDSPRGKEIIIQGDHMEDVAQMVVSKFNVPGTSVFLDMEGKFVAFG
jgi:density-regulated protein DRP1